MVPIICDILACAASTAFSSVVLGSVKSIITLADLTSSKISETILIFISATPITSPISLPIHSEPDASDAPIISISES